MNIIFDLDDTIYDQFSPFQQAYELTFHIDESIDIYKLYIDSRKYSEFVFHLTENGEMDITDMHAYRIQEACKEQGIVVDRADALTFQTEYLNQQSKITVVPEIQQVLNLCKEQGIGIGMITNGPSQHQRMKMKALGLEKWFENERIIISSEVDCAKPNKVIFEMAEKQFELNVNDTYYIGDSFRNDVVGAISAGWKIIWVNQRNHVTDESEYTPDYIIHDVTELMPLVTSLIEKWKMKRL
ncbi:HAD family hydrolase [Bacillus sp. JJ722]|uniref:HAD family hydrolase n=1 Tax=Bacillus sp. JJ722 TaxID=3122973 RepID=UPI002FFFC882